MKKIDPILKGLTMNTITKLSVDPSAVPDTNDLDGWVVVDGSPTMRTWALHKNADGSMLSGMWEATPGTYHATYSAYEFVHMISGRIVITPDGGTPVTVQAGDAFVVEADFKGTWEIQEAVRKHFDFKL
ncbi:cupin domain-containing protein [Yoonia sp.]|jgi:uncharacterized protein|uniref:cupin domain-containing protein n=1 Tax=Yoonia sp. TaxID=2212373 RepID=UPI00262FAFA7|nr:cupin domain-containing protein [Yoonia sp.]